MDTRETMKTDNSAVYDTTAAKHMDSLDPGDFPAAHRYDFDDQGRLVSIWRPLNRTLTSRAEVVEDPPESLINEVRVQEEVHKAALNRSLEAQLATDLLVDGQATDHAILGELGFDPEQFIPSSPNEPLGN